MINNAYLNRVFADLQKNHPNEPEFLQAVDEVFESLQHVVDKHPEWEEAGLMERFVEPAVSYTHLTLPTKRIV